MKEQAYPERPDNALLMQMLAEIRSLREDTNQRFAEQREDSDRRFAELDRRFNRTNQVKRRLALPL